MSSPQTKRKRHSSSTKGTDSKHLPPSPPKKSGGDAEFMKRCEEVLQLAFSPPHRHHAFFVSVKSVIFPNRSVEHRPREGESDIHCVLLQVRKVNGFFMNFTICPPRPQPMPETWKPQDEHGDPLPRPEAFEEWISASSQVVPLGGQFMFDEGLVINRWGMVGRPIEVCAFSLLITPVHNSANNPSQFSTITLFCCKINNCFTQHTP